MAAVRAAAARASRVPVPLPGPVPSPPLGSRGPGRGDTWDTGPTSGACQWAGAGRDGPACPGEPRAAGAGGAPCPPAGLLGPSRPEQGWSEAGGVLGAARRLACALGVGGCAPKGQRAGGGRRGRGRAGRAGALGCSALGLPGCPLWSVCSPETLREPWCSRNRKLEGGSSPGNCLLFFFFFFPPSRQGRSRHSPALPFPLFSHGQRSLTLRVPVFVEGDTLGVP